MNQYRNIDAVFNFTKFLVVVTRYHPVISRYSYISRACGPMYQLHRLSLLLALVRGTVLVQLFTIGVLRITNSHQCDDYSQCSFG